MPQIKCPKCGEVFTPTDNEYESIVKEIRSIEFQKEVDKELAIQQAKFKEEKLKSSIEYQQEIETLKARLNSIEKDKQIDLMKVTQAQDLKIKELENKILTDEKNHRILLDEKEKQIEFYRDLKTKASTKMLGETLEQHCEIAFNQVRAMAFPNAYFEKDTTTPDGTKGDYIFKENTPEGAELLSIMFEMKNEADKTATKHKNEDFFAKLDKDRKDKGCEFAVLVSLLEADNEYYNTGIVEVAPSKYEKMYVIRPQFFIPLISLLRNMALREASVKNELVAIKNKQVDLTKLNEEIDEFKRAFGKNMGTAGSRFKDAIDEIDKTIIHLGKVKEALEGSIKQLGYASDKLEDLSMTKLLRHSPSLKEEFQNIEKENK